MVAHAHRHMQAVKELASDARYDQEMTNSLLTGFAAGTIGQMVDMKIQETSYIV